MMTLNFKAPLSAVAALALTVFLSWTFVDATSLASVQRHHGDTSILAAVSSLVR